MTATSLPTPNRTESLRERLIREGKIVPAIDSSSENVQNTAEKRRQLAEDLDKVCLILETLPLGKLRREKIYNLYLKTLYIYENLLFFNKNEIDEIHKNVTFDYFFALSLKYLKFIYCTLKNLDKFLSNKVSVLRSGFFFAFKESMKNTP